MKLTTIRRDGQARPALVVTNEGLRAKWCVDLAEINALASDPTANLSVEPIPASVLGIIRAGPSALENLKRLQDLLLDSIAGGGQERFGRALVRPDAVYWLPPIPDSPLFITFHGNSVGLWRDRSVEMAHRPIISRVPACRLHLVTSNLGHLEPLIFAEGDSVQYGNELGVVIAPGGKNISYEDADDHVWGVMNCDDVTRFTWAQHFPQSPGRMGPHIGDARARLGRASDAACPAGPWITTIDEIGDPLELLMHAWGPDGGYDRAHTWAYIMGPRNALGYMSRFMTLPPGSILQLGAAGVDGVGMLPDPKAVHGQAVEVSLEGGGTLSNPIWCEGDSDLQRDPGEAFYGLITRHRGLDLAKAFCPDAQPFPHGTRGVWSVRYNDRETAKGPDGGPDLARHYEILPRNSLSTGEPVEIPRHGERIDVSCELAAVIGTRPVGRVAADEALEYLAGLTIMVGMRDNGLVAELESPTSREIPFAEIFGRWYDGFNAVKPDLKPLGPNGAVGDREMRLVLNGVGEVVTRTSDYLLDFGQVISFLSKEITLLPGDVVSLGAAGKWLVIPADHKLAEGATLHASIEGLGDFRVPLVDLRGPHPPLHEVA